MTTPASPRFVSPLLAAAASLSLLAGIAGCKSTVDDATLNKNVQSALSGDPVLGQQPIQVSVQNGIVTLNGSVTDKTARTVAAQDAVKVAGVKEVVNNLVVGTSYADNTQPASGPAPVQTPPPPDRVMPASKPSPAKSPDRHTPPPAPAPAAPAPAPAPVASTPPPPPPAPIERPVTINLPEGTTLPIRITQTLDSASTQPGQSFSGVVTRDIIRDGYLVLPAGAAVSGRVVDVKDATHFKGSSLLSVELSSVRRHGDLIPLHTEPYTVEGKGRGKNTAEKVGGGAAVGALLGGLLGGGKGAAIGAGVGGAGGAGVQAMTKGQQVQITSESVINFRTTAPFSVTTTEHAHEPASGGLQPR